MVSPQTNVIDTGNMYKGWFPTLQRTLWILSKLYQCVNVCFVYSKQLFRKITLTLNFFSQTTIFDDIAQDVVDLCLQSLLTASELIIKEVIIILYDTIFFFFKKKKIYSTNISLL
jgi:hypothetical protein